MMDSDILRSIGFSLALVGGIAVLALVFFAVA
jgi:hypothetical protein